MRESVKINLIDKPKKRIRETLNQEGIKELALYRLVMHDPVLSSYLARIKELESKIAHLQLKLSGLKYEIKFIADFLRKEQSKK
ncbi:hypothetical protein ES703_91496 [subsurface metagenome]